METITSVNEPRETKTKHNLENPKVDPNFIIIGGQKCSTTWLFKLLTQHPQIFIPESKELNFYNKRFNYEKGINWYRSQFKKGYNGEQAVGECTPNYLWTSNDPEDLMESDRTENIPELIHRDYPNIKLIAILREPVDRAVSAFHHHIRSRDLPPSARMADVYSKRGILTMGYYDNDLENWYRYFSREQLLVLFYDDILKTPSEVITQIFSFLEVDTSFVPEHIKSRYNIRYGSSYLYLHYYFPLAAKALRVTFPPFIRYNWPEIKVSESEKAQLKELFRPHVKRLEDILKRSTPWDY